MSENVYDLTSKLTGRGDQHPTLKANYKLKNEVPALRSNEFGACEPLRIDESFFGETTQ